MMTDVIILNYGKKMILKKETVLSFLDKQCVMLRDLNLNNYSELYFVKSNQKIIEILGKLRWIDNFVHIIVEKLCNV